MHWNCMASFHSEGNKPEEYDMLDKSDNAGARVRLQFFRTFPLMLSGPTALLGFKFLSMDITRSGLKSIYQSILSGESMGIS